MPETLETADGAPVPLDDTDARFAAAMAAPRGDEPEHPAPPERPPADPEAPFGRKIDGTPKKRPGGRPPTRPREITAPPAAAGSSSARSSPPSAGPQDYTGGLTEFSEALWMVLAATPVPWETIRIRVRAQAWVLAQNQAGVVQGVNIMAQHNGTVRAGVEKLTTGSAGWVLPAVMALAPFGVQTALIWRAPPNGDMEALAAQTEAAWERTFASMRAEFEGAMSAPADDPVTPEGGRAGAAAAASGAGNDPSSPAAAA